MTAAMRQLQWGRRPESAEGIVLVVFGYQFGALQWGRRPGSAEGGRHGRGRGRLRHASMGPQTWVRGRQAA